MSGRDPYVVVQELGREVGPVGPCERVKLGMNLKLAEHCRIAERLEHRAVQFWAEVDLARGAAADAGGREPIRVFEEA